MKVPSFVLRNEFPKMCDGISVEVDSSLHGIRVHLFVTSLCFLLEQEQHSIDLDRATNVILHVVHVHFKIFLGGDLSQLLRVFLNLLLDLILSFGFSELAN